MIKKKVSWKNKKPYEIVSLEIFNSQEMGTTFANDTQKLMGRTVEKPLSELTGDKSKHHIKVLFEVDQVEGEKAKTKFKTFSLDSKYIRSKVKKGADKIECVNNLGLSDAKLWVKVTVMTHYSTQTSKRKTISSEVSKTLHKHKDSSLDDFLQEALFSKLGTEIYHKVKKIVPVRRVEVEKVKVL